jgi:hypothetical protein
MVRQKAVGVKDARSGSLGPLPNNLALERWDRFIRAVVTLRGGGHYRNFGFVLQVYTMPMDADG